MLAPFISLSIVSHGNSKEVFHLLTSLQKCEQETERFQIILTDNLGNDLPNFDSTSWISVDMIRNDKPKGFAENHNQAFQLAQGKYFVVLNPDLIFEQPVFSDLINKLEIHKADLIAPQIVDKKGITQDSFRGLPTPLKLIKRRLVGEKKESFHTNPDGLVQPDWIAGMFWLMRSEIYRRLGGMDEKFFLYFEDVDFCTRARLQEMKIFIDTNVQVQHDAQHSSRKSLYYLFLHLWSAIQFFTSPVYRHALRTK